MNLSFPPASIDARRKTSIFFCFFLFVVVVVVVAVVACRPICGNPNDPGAFHTILLSPPV